VLAALLEREGAEVIRLGTAPDDPMQFNRCFNRGRAEKADLIVTSAGVSVGAFDYIRQVIRGQRAAWISGKSICARASRWRLVRYGIPLIGSAGQPGICICGLHGVFHSAAVHKLSGREQRLPYRAKAVLSESD
jgi:molybdopterin molybdotransferase